MSKIGNGGKGIAWNTEDEVTLLNALNKFFHLLLVLPDAYDLYLLSYPKPPKL
jgi:hypothetical protein